MKPAFVRTPSAAMVISIVALVIAASGTAVAADKLVNGNKLIKKGTLSGNRLRKHTLTGAQINMSKLGRVPKAETAIRATTATNAVNAVNAVNAGQLGHQSASSFLQSSSRIGTKGIVKSSSSSAGTMTTLFTTGPFTVTMECTNTGSGITLTLSGSSSEANSVINGTLVPTANTPTDLGDTDLSGPTTGFNEIDDITIDLEALSGAQAILVGADGVNSLGADCWSNWAGVR